MKEVRHLELLLAVETSIKLLAHICVDQETEEEDAMLIRLSLSPFYSVLDSSL